MTAKDVAVVLASPVLEATPPPAGVGGWADDRLGQPSESTFLVTVTRSLCVGGGAHTACANQILLSGKF